ncbi:hypothetical protein [Arenimonas sp.]|uniref:hypothetical protein n=1 Tax=Arenimonas sp. TaxID=1872635 RepID=UPI0039E476C8
MDRVQRMDRIAIVDDNAEMRSTLAGHVRLEIDARGLSWEVLEIAPLPDLNDYSPWLLANDVRVLVLDEKLSGSADEAGADYSGHDIAAIVRQQVPDLPQVIVTSVKNSDDLDDAAEELDAIVARNDFDEQPDLYVERMLRMGKSYLGRYESQLAEFGRIVRAVAAGDVNESDISRLEAIRASTQSSFSITEVTTSREWLDRAKELKAKLEEAVMLLREQARK